jgi:hypothetical protein
VDDRVVTMQVSWLAYYDEQYTDMPFYVLFASLSQLCYAHYPSTPRTILIFWPILRSRDDFCSYGTQPGKSDFNLSV